MIHPTAKIAHAARNGRSAFTLLEILIVVAIIVMLAGAGGYFLYSRYDEAKEGYAKRGVREMASRVSTYRLNNNDEIPATLMALTQPQPSGGAPLALPDEILDPWNKPYQIESDGSNVVVFTMTPKGKRIDNVTR